MTDPNRRVLVIMGIGIVLALCGFGLVRAGWLDWTVPAAATLVAFVTAGFVARRKNISS